MTVGFLGGKFLPFHQGHIYMIMAASNMVDKLYVILSSSENRDRELCKRDGIKYMPAEVRLSWIGRSLNDLDNIEIINIKDDHWNDDYNWEEGASAIKAAIPEKITHVFSSEPEYDKYFSIYYPEAKHIVIDEGRDIVNISATELRKNIYKHWNMLPSSVANFFVKKVAIVGTESVGKSTLVKKLAKFYNTKYISEVGRDYCEKYKNMLTPDIFNFIAMKHFLSQEEQCNKLLFIDSEAVTTQYYLEAYAKKENFTFDNNLIKSIIKLQKYDLILYLEPDVKWINDGFRFLGEEEERRKNNEYLKWLFTHFGFQYNIISGSYSERFNQSIELVNSIINQGGLI